VNDLAAALYAAVAELPRAHVDILARTLKRIERPTRDTALILKEANAAPGYRAHAGRIAEAWLTAQDRTNGVGMALALEALGVAELERSRQQLEVVWTGPALEIVDCRATRAVQLSLITEARKSVMLMTFNASDTELMDALNDAVERGVRVAFIPETVGFESDPKRAFNRLDRKVRIYEWPEEDREKVGAYVARLHAKTVVVDDRRALVTSANVSYAAAMKNIEVGVLVTGGLLPPELASQIRQLIDAGVLQRLQRPKGGW
jgi:phosphatidylserine/phosphatidylglycerophosphate/cardiolipin synthase-like enzyme|tara:strand:+ start:148 stop:930 length:783 start_codon:yes stop_codon:yes gene_type:complete